MCVWGFIMGTYGNWYVATNPCSIHLRAIPTFRRYASNLVLVVFGSVVDGVCETVLLDKVVFCGRRGSERGDVWHCFTQLCSCTANSPWKYNESIFKRRKKYAWLLPGFAGPATFLLVLPLNDHLMAQKIGCKIL